VVAAPREVWPSVSYLDLRVDSIRIFDAEKEANITVNYLEKREYIICG
jgi:hypothetical protein